MYEVFEQLLQKFGVTTADVCKATGIGQSTISNWKSRRNLLSGKNAQLIADYFGVSVDYLMTGKEKEGGEKYYLNDETSEIAQEIFENKELRLLFDAAKDAQPEDLQTVHQMLLALKRKERGDIDWLPSSFNQFSYWKNKRSRYGKWGRKLHNIYWREVI